MKKLLKTPLAEIKYAGSNKRMKKFIKKNEKDPVDEKYPLRKRQAYSMKKFGSYFKMKGIKITHTGREFLPKGTYIMVPNYTTDLDYQIIMAAMGEERRATVVLDDTKRKAKGSGFVKGFSGFYSKNRLDKEDQSINAATSWAKSFNTPIIMFPEKELSDEITEFSVVPFELAKKFFLPVVPVTISGSRQAIAKGGSVKITFHSPIKPMQITAQKPERVAHNIKTKVEQAL